MAREKVKSFPTYNITLGEAILIVKYRLNDADIALQSKILAIEKVANMETHNCITKADLVGALRWVFDHYDFEE